MVDELQQQRHTLVLTVPEAAKFRWWFSNQRTYRYHLYARLRNRRDLQAIHRDVHRIQAKTLASVFTIVVALVRYGSLCPILVIEGFDTVVAGSSERAKIIGNAPI